MSHEVALLQGAVFISDAHENENRDSLEKYIDSILNKSIKSPSQLFLMGDMFDLLVGEIEYSKLINQNLIEKIDSLAKKIPIFYIEGNHDFNLKKVFKNVHTIPFKKQPFRVQTPKGDLLILHGDRFEGFKYRLYSKFIRSCVTLKVLNFLDKIFKYKISKKLLNFLGKKDICKKWLDFEDRAKKRLNDYPIKDVWGVIEGHFHQGVFLKLEKVNYFNLSSFACERSYFVVQCIQSMQCEIVKGQ